MRKILYGVWKGVKYDNTEGGRAAPLDLPLDKIETFNPGNPVDAVVCNFGFLVFDPNVSLAGVLLRYYALARENSCGACTPCRTGSILLAECLRDAVEGRGDTVDWDHMLDSAEQMKYTSLCGIGRTTPEPRRR